MEADCGDREASESAGNGHVSTGAGIARDSGLAISNGILELGLSRHRQRHRQQEEQKFWKKFQVCFHD